MQCKWLQICCLCVAIQVQFIVAASTRSSTAAQRENQQPQSYNTANNNEWQYPDADHFAGSQSHANSETGPTLSSTNGQQNVQQQYRYPSQPNNNYGKTQSLAGKPGRQSNGHGSQPSRYLCSRFTEDYDCQFKDVHLKNGQIFNFGQENNNYEQNLTFLDSTLEYLPKSLVDAFPLSTLLNLNGLKINSIDPNAFEKAANVKTVYLENNRLVNIARDTFRGAQKLNILVLSKNEINNVDSHAFDSNNVLEYLYLDQNRLNALPAFTNTASLKYLNASHNNLASINDRHFQNLQYLQTLDVSFNQLQRLDLQNINYKVDQIDVSYNVLTELVMPTHVTHLYAKNNSLQEFAVGQQCYLVKLDLARNQLTTLQNLHSCLALEHLDLSNNLLEAFDFRSSLSKLQYLNLAHNNLFEFFQPIHSRSTPMNLRILDLSHNKLSHGPALKDFQKLELVLLNDNDLILLKSYANTTQENFKSYRMANNQWSCLEIQKFEHWTLDKDKNLCAGVMRDQNGICCVEYSKPYNDRLNQILREADFHERENKKKCRKPESTSSNQMSNHDEIRNAIANAGTEKAGKLKEIDTLKTTEHSLQEILKKLNNDRDRLNDSERSLALEIEKQRQFYRVTKEGLISSKEMLERIIKFVEEKAAFNRDLQSRRQKDTEDSNSLYDEKKQEMDVLKGKISNLQNTLGALKQEERSKKKEKDQLEKQVNKNAASIHGGSGRIS